ncbi:MAG: hypothetical protein KDD82_13330 [Planctomycetes bacterium]|nr:hypothetical protein [Planctomycetota bacterium]
MKRTWTAAVGLAATLALSGCGAAYYGTALAILQSQKSKKVTDVSFPDGVPTSSELPAFATLRLSTTPADKTLNGTLTSDLELLGVDFPEGYGTSLSNRDTGTTLVDGDRLVIRINQDASRELQFTAADVAANGPAVAAAIQAKVRALTPVNSGVAPEAYSLFSASFEAATRAYRFRSGAPGATSEVRFQTQPRAGSSDVTPSAASTQTSARLGLGASNRGSERGGEQSVSYVVLNRGTDVIPAGTPVDLYLSRDKTLDTTQDLRFDRLALTDAVQVGEARRFYRTNANAPPERILRQELPPGRYWVLFALSSAGEQETGNNLLVSRLPVEVYDPVDDPATAASETAAPLDFVIQRTTSPIAAVTSADLVTQLQVQNLGAAVAAPEALIVDVLLSGDQILDEPAAFTDPAGAVAGLVVNPTSPLRPITVRFQTGGVGVTTTVTADTVLVSYDGSATVQQALTAINASSGGLVVARLDGKGNANTDTLPNLLSAAQKTEALAKDTLLASQAITFAVADRPLVTQSFTVSAPIPPSNFATNVLPLRLFPLYRLRPSTVSSPAENAKNNVRRASNYVRVYDRTKATVDFTTGAVLPTVNGDDFARLEAVTQRPVNVGTIRQGQQRVFSFEIPDTGLALNESQLLVIVDTTNFDAHLDLLSPSGALLANNDDSALGFSPVIYTPLQGLGSGANLVYYLVVSTALIDESDLGGGGEQFNVTISVNPREPGDPGPVSVVNAGNVVDSLNRRFVGSEPELENDVLIPFSLASSQSEVVFVLPQRARVVFQTSPVFQVGVDTVITAFVPSSVPAPVQQQAVLGPNFRRVVYRPSGGAAENAHVLERGVYTLAFDSPNKTPDAQALRLEVGTRFIPED